MTEPMPNPLTLSVLAEAIKDAIWPTTEWDSEHACLSVSEAAARALLTTIENAGYKVAPVEATDEMVAVGEWFDDYAAAYAAMLSAAPHITEED